jgi:glucosyl-3-phosphoglycerate synthase
VTVLPAPAPDLDACVVVPAHDEEALVHGCLRALAVQEGEFEVLLVLDRCADATEQRARDAARDLTLHVIHSDGVGVGAARALGMGLACERLLALGRAHGLIASTDADSQVEPGWLAAQLAAVARGSLAIGGRVRVGDELSPAVERQREIAAAARLEQARASAHPRARTEHHQFSGASMALTAATYARIGPLDPRRALEDETLERALRRHAIPVDRLDAVRVTTSGRRDGRAPRGLAVDLRRSWWLANHSHDGAAFGLDELVARKTDTVSLVLPAREVAATIGPLLDAIAPLERAGLVDEVLVVDADSHDDSARIAAEHGARVAFESELMPGYGPTLGKGDAMWRGLAATNGTIVAFLDTDTEDFHAGFVTGLLGPLLTRPETAFVKATFRRPLRVGDTVIPDGGGRVTELLARPYLNLHLPDLAAFSQPLAGEVAARRELLERLPFPVGYGVEIAMLIDVLREVGLEAMAQVDLGTRQNRHQPLHALSAMALAVLAAAERRVHGAAVEAAVPGPLLVPHDGELEMRSVVLDERPPLAQVGTARRASA